MVTGALSTISATPTIVVSADPPVGRAVPAGVACFHCGTACGEAPLTVSDRAFCCWGCRTVYELLQEQGLGQYYQLGQAPGVRQVGEGTPDRYAYLDHPGIRERLLDFAGEETCRVTFSVPAIHCVACVWLLEQVFRFGDGIGSSTVDFAQKRVSIRFDPRRTTLSRVAGLLDSLGYAPDLRLSDLDRAEAPAVSRRLWLQLGVAGFVFGNTMLFSLPGYFGLDAFSGSDFRSLFGILSLLLSIPVVTWSAADYWRAAWVGLKHRRLSLEVPIAVGIVALFGQSVVEVFTGAGEGYFDSLAGLLFFLLTGRVFQQKAFGRLTFDRDYRSFFPLSVVRVFPDPTGSQREERVGLDRLNVGDQLRIRNGELIPADSRLMGGEALIDYSFVTGESEPVRRQPGELLYAGGSQTAGAIEIEITKPVSQGYLTSLWNQEAFRKDRDDTADSITNRYSVRFTWTILALALGAVAFWGWRDPSRAVPAFVGILIVACPCALALAAPYTLGTALRVLGRRGIFLRNTQVLESLAEVDAVVFDKTGTLTTAQGREVVFEGAPLAASEWAAIRALATQSSHPLSRRLAEVSAVEASRSVSVNGFGEVLGLGVQGWITGEHWVMGSVRWLRQNSIRDMPEAGETGSVLVARNGLHRGAFVISNSLRNEVGELVADLRCSHELTLLSGDNGRERSRFRTVFGCSATLAFDRTPVQKLEFIQDRQNAGRTVMMVGDGLNDSGALRQSDVGVAVVEKIGAFSPASDVILEATRLPRLANLLRFSKSTVGLVRASFVISTLYNLVGLSIAASGRLSPVVCAILMPLSSITVVAFAVGAAEWMGRRSGLGPVLGEGGISA